MAKFTISLSVEVEADSYKEAWEIERSLHLYIHGHKEALDVHGERVEQTDGDEDEE